MNWHHSPGIFWLRVGPIGILIQDTRRHRLLFSQRNGYTKKVLLGPYYFGLLPKVP